MGGCVAGLSLGQQEACPAWAGAAALTVRVGQSLEQVKAGPAWAGAIALIVRVGPLLGQQISCPAWADASAHTVWVGLSLRKVAGPAWAGTRALTVWELSGRSLGWALCGRVRRAHCMGRMLVQSRVGPAWAGAAALTGRVGQSLGQQEEAPCVGGCECNHCSGRAIARAAGGRPCVGGCIAIIVWVGPSLGQGNRRSGAVRCGWLRGQEHC